MEAGGLANAYGNGITIPFLVIYLHNVRDFSAMAVAGAGNADFWPSQSTLLAGLTPPPRRHAAYALQRVTRNLGIGLGGVTGGFIATTSSPGSFTVLFLRVFVGVVVRNVVFVSAGYAVFELLPVFAKNEASVAVAAMVFGLGECFQGPTQGALVADLAPARLRGRYMALSTISWEIGFVIGPAAGGLILGLSPLALWPIAAGVCVAAGAAALALERGIPRELRLTPA